MIRVGGATEVEVKERKDRVDDAMHATRAAVEEGILPGGGVALLRASEALKKVRTAQRRPEDRHRDRPQGARRLRPARSPSNAGEDGSVIVGKILEKDQYAFGFDAQTGEYVDMVKKGIIDPTKVVRTALQDAASVAGLLITTEAMVAEVPKKKACRHAADAGRRRDGLLSDPKPTSGDVNAKAREKSRAFCVQGTMRGAAKMETTTNERCAFIRRHPIHRGRLGDESYIDTSSIAT